MFKKLILSILLLFISVGFSGCMLSRGSEAITKQENLNQIVPYKSTKDDVKAILGEPDSILTLNGGKEKWIYSHTDANLSILNYYKIALTGSGKSMATTKSTILTLVFNSNGLLINKKFGY